MCLFCEFISGVRKKHTNGLPFKILNETKHSISFLSIDFPKHSSGHILVVPKKHYENLEDIPKTLLHDISEHVARSCEILRKRHSACNVLLNNGKEAGQTIFHTHFHIIPRDHNDDVEIEVWKRRQMREEEFKKLISELRRDFKKY